MTIARIDIETAGLTNLMALTDPRHFDRSIKAGLRYSSRAAKAEAAKQIGARYSIPASRIKQDIGKPFVSGTSLVLGFATKAPTVRAFGAKSLARGGLTYTIYRGARTRNTKAFMLPVGQGVPVTASRTRRTSSGKPKLRTIYGPSIGRIFVGGRSRFGNEIRRLTTERVQAQFMAGVKREWARRARGF